MFRIIIISIVLMAWSITGAFSQASEKEIVRPNHKIRAIAMNLDDAESVNASHESAEQQLVFTNIIDYKKCRKAYPDFPEYKDTDNQQEDNARFNAEIINWSKMHPQEYEMLLRYTNEVKDIRKE